MMAIPIKNGVGVDKALVVRAMVVARPVMVVTMKGRSGALGIASERDRSETVDLRAPIGAGSLGVKRVDGPMPQDC